MSSVRLPSTALRFGARQIGRHVLRADLPWEVQRQRLDQVMAGSLLPKGTAVSERVLKGVYAQVVTVGDVRAQRTVVHFHGGGYCVGSARMARAWAAYLSQQAGCQVVLPEYRLAPEHPHPAALEDAQSVMAGLLADVAPASVVLSGDSAGGGLALSLLLSMRDGGQELPAGCVLLSPWLDLAADRSADPVLARKDVLLTPRWLRACATAYADPTAWSDPAVSPLRADPGGLPPLLIQSGSEELLAPDAQALAASASAAGVDVSYTRWPRMWHDFELQPGLLATADSAVAQAAWFVGKVTTA
jgi:epsilon-lactone hydrolase